jgi:hypothetical protein
MVCPASVRATIDLPDTTSAAAEEGTRAHADAEKCLRNGTESTDPYVNDYLGYVRALDGKLWIEQKIDLTEWIHNGYGTADAVVYESNHLHVLDLKFGVGIKVNAVGNRQLQIYALGAYTAFARHGYDIKAVTVHIVQPRLEHTDAWSIPIDDLLTFGGELYDAAQACLDEAARYNPTEKACQWCRAKATCPALYEHSLKIVGEDFDPVPADDLTDEQIRLVLDNKPLIEAWLRSVESQVFTRIEHGETFDGWKMVEGRSVRKWRDDAESKLRDLFGEDMFTTKLKNITEIEKSIGKKRFKELELTSKPEGKPVLVKDSDPRPAIGNTVDDFHKR